MCHPRGKHWLPTWSQSPLVDPRMHFAPLSLQLIDVCSQIHNLALQRLYFIAEGLERSVERLRQEVGCSLHLDRIARGDSIVAAAAITIAHALSSTCHRRRAVLAGDFCGLILPSVHRAVFAHQRIRRLVGLSRGAWPAVVDGVVAVLIVVGLTVVLAVVRAVGVVIDVGPWTVKSAHSVHVCVA